MQKNINNHTKTLFWFPFNAEKREALHVPSESGGQSVIDSTPTRLLLDGEDDNNTGGGGGGGGGGGIYGDRHREDHQTGSSDSRRGSRHKEFGGGKSGGDLSGHHHTNSRRQNLNRYQAEKGFGGTNGNIRSGNGGSNSDMGGYESAPEGRRVRLKHRTTYGGIIVDDDDDEEEVGEKGGGTGNDDDALSSSTHHYKQQQSVDSSQTVAGTGGNGGNNKGHYHHPKMASNPLFRSDGLPGYPGPPGFDPAVYFDEKQTSNGPPSVEYSAPSAGFLLSSSSDPSVSATVYDENGLEHLTQNHLNSHHQEKAAYSDVKTSSSSLSHQKMARDRGDHHPHHPHHPHHHQPGGGGPAVAVVAPPPPPPQSTPAMNSHEPLPVAFPKAGGNSHLAGIEKRHKGGGVGSAAVVGLPKSSVLPHHHHPHYHHLMMSPVAGAGATSPQVTSHQDIYRMLSTAAVAAGGNGPPIAGPLVPSGYEAASKLCWLTKV